MNFLAHIYLSFGNDEITIGNFIADSIRGNRHKHLPMNVQKGIMLHRAIDTFTDAHPTVRKSTRRLHENYSHYSGVIVDIFYDHFLAKNWDQYSNTPLEIFVERFYDLLEENYTILPDGVKRMMPYMISDNWIYNYSNLDGISRVLSGMNRRTNNRSKMNYAILDLETHYIDFEKEFSVFFEELKTYSKNQFDLLISN
ncbi:acyl carrier protein phosphodiesterase [Sediminicola sp. 1XM1-17]|uniref:acyl carrier protein phosphodiesterase n=1 Tax=Sediminicola sp. 1XM1-17 TaxID=3127702 RepID=UPI0030783812